ncbi:hypothetical protein D3C77_317410 [compost metagenome]
MLSGFQCLEADLGVYGRNGQINDDADLRVAEQLIRSTGAGDVIFLRLLPSPAQVKISAGCQLKNTEFVAVFHINAADFSAADNANLHFVHHTTLLFNAGGK